MINKCKDCRKEISRNSIRCKSCSNKSRAGKYNLSDSAKNNISKSLKGKRENLVVLCKKCHAKKTYHKDKTALWEKNH